MEYISKDKKAYTRGGVDTGDKIYYDTIDCMDLIHARYRFIPIWIIRRILYAEELYMKKIGIIDYEPELSWWAYRNHKNSKRS